MAKREDNLKPIKKGELTREEAKKRGSAGGKKSAAKRKENKLIRERILSRMKESDWDEYIDGIIERAKDSKADAEFLRDTIGQKPVEKVEHTIDDRSLDRLNEDFGIER